MNLLKKILLVTLLISGLTVGAFANGLNLNGMGAKAISMGGAFIGLADDFSAVFWNPAGLTQMKEANLSVFSSFIIPTGTYEYAPAGISLETESAVFPAPAFTYFKPISDKLVIGLAAYATAGSGAEWDGSKLLPLSGGMDLIWKSKVGGITFSPVVAYKVSDSLSIGLTLNIVYGMLDMERPAALGQYTENLTGVGFGATIGLFYKLSDAFSFGFTYKTPQKVKLTGESDMPGAAMLGLPAMSESEREVSWPMWMGGGIAVKPTDKLTITFDVQYTNWAKLQDIPITFADAGWETYIAEGSKFELKWKDAVQIRAGFEYLISDSFALRAGYYNDPTVSPGTTLNILIPQLSYSVFTVGFGYSTDKLNLDVGFEYLKGTDRDADMALGLAMPGTHGMNMLVPMVSLTYKF